MQELKTHYSNVQHITRTYPNITSIKRLGHNRKQLLIKNEGTREPCPPTTSGASMSPTCWCSNTIGVEARMKPCQHFLTTRLEPSSPPHPLRGLLDTVRKHAFIIARHENPHCFIHCSNKMEKQNQYNLWFKKKCTYIILCPKGGLAKAWNRPRGWST